MDFGNWLVTVTLVMALLSTNQVVSSLRFFVVARAFSVPAELSRAHRVNLSSIAGSMLLFNFLGQGLTRAVLFRDYCVSRSVMFLITALERALSLAVLICIGAIALLSTYGIASVKWAVLFGAAIVAVVVVVALAVVFFSALGCQARREAIDAFRGRLMGRLALATALTIIMHVAMLSAYALLAANVLGAPIDAQVLAAAAATMLGAAFPAAPGGWGAREITSVYAFSQLGGTTAQGVEIGVTIGLLSLAALAVNFALVFAARIGRRAVLSRAQGMKGMAERALSLRRLRALCWIGPLLVALLAAFQAPVPMGAGFVNINLADPVAIVVALSALSVLLLGFTRGRAWTPQAFAWALAALGASVFVAFVIGFARHGLIEWALVNRLVGLGVAFSFLISGAFLSVVSGAVAVRRLARALAQLVAIIVVFEYSIRVAGLGPYFEVLHWHEPNFVGFLGNRNAWSLFLCITLALFLGSRAERRSDVSFHLIASIIIFGVALTGSRTGFAALFLVIAFMVALGRTDLKRLALATAAVFAGAVLIDMSMGFGPSAIAALGYITPLTHVQADRLASLVGGWNLFIEHPFFGAGLGAFMHQQIETTGRPLVIHSSYLWLLAEFGVVGALLFLSPVLLAVRQMVIDPSWRRSDEAAALMATFLVIGVFSATHDVAYQRLFWLALGLLAARPAALRGALRRTEAAVEAPASVALAQEPERPATRRIEDAPIGGIRRIEPVV